MKKVLLFLLLLVSVQTFAQIRRTAVFDFTNPTALNPSITPEPENAGGNEEAYNSGEREKERGSTQGQGEEEETVI